MRLVRLRRRVQGPEIRDWYRDATFARVMPEQVACLYIEQCQKKLILLFVVAAAPQQQTTGQPF
jgi:hypothetical protein